MSSIINQKATTDLWIFVFQIVMLSKRRTWCCLQLLMLLSQWDKQTAQKCCLEWKSNDVVHVEYHDMLYNWLSAQAPSWIAFKLAYLYFVASL